MILPEKELIEMLKELEAIARLLRKCNDDISNEEDSETILISDLDSETIMFHLSRINRIVKDLGLDVR